MNRRRFLSALGILLCSAQVALGALAVDSRMPSATGFGNSGAAPSFSFTNTAGTLLVCGGVYGNVAASSITGMTYAGAAMTSAGTAASWDGGNSAAAMFYKLSPATGANTVVISFTGATGGGSGLTAGCISYTGHHLVTPIKTYLTNTGSGSLVSIAMTSTTTGNLLFDVAGCGTDMKTPDNVTLSWANNFSSASAGGNGRSAEGSGTGGTVTLSHTVNGSDSWGIVGVEIAAAAGGGGGTPGCKNGLLLQGAGCEVHP